MQSFFRILACQYSTSSFLLSRIIEPNSSIGYTDNHQYRNAHENIFNQKEENSERRFTTSQKKIAMKRHSMPFGLQASGPLTSKTPIENFRFEGRQFAVATQEKVCHASSIKHFYHLSV